MSSTRISHVVIKVQNVALAKPFYDRLCTFLGLKEIHSSKSSFAYYNRNFSIWVSRASKKGRFSRGNVGYDHIALSASSRKQVDLLQDLLNKNGDKILYPAEEHPEFAPRYYSVSFFDPDGTIIELLHLPKGKRSYG